MSETSLTAKERIESLVTANAITMKAVFVPWSRSRNAGQKNPSLNWKVTIEKNGREVLTTDYSAGCARCPSYKASVKELGSRNCIMRDNAIRIECETGEERRCGSSTGIVVNRNPIIPDLADVLYLLASNASAIDSPTYEDWASEIGYDSDSRNGEAIYRACLEIGLKLRAALGDKVLSELREACQDF